MAIKLSENMSKLIHRMGREREDRIISGETKLTVAAIFLIDDNSGIRRIDVMVHAKEVKTLTESDWDQ